ncbi:DUF3105 domain-containing protein [Streptomyces tsukubensis]|uniref:DUF3105 domain-containing protein n=2 Tax=Streptomyces TaxID=1883 RepID=A0A1V4A0Y9_9ACTN|nr:DUF3105 domain-containing protein [Streptomyces tsukubensis]OON72042.1 hypothetical protein B1H18_31160 [Streptomyces tsukubensis]QFR93260.1 DUF3105 domain-containing protein [Streptomyces tsukubensis]
MGSAKNTSKSANDRRARIAEMRRAERSRDRRNRTLAITLSAVVVAGVVGFGAFVLTKESDDSDKEKAAASAPVAGEKSWDAKKLGRDHVTRRVDYPMNPPVGGDHDAVWMNCDGDVYDKAIPEVNAVHSLEHGAVWVTYNGEAADADIKALGSKVDKTPYSLMSPVADQKGALMLSAWGKQVTVKSAKDPRVNQFFSKYVQGPQTPEPGAACTQGRDA